MADITDPSTELLHLCTALKNVDSRDETRKTLARKFDIAVDSPEFFAILAAISSRIARLRSLVNSLTGISDSFHRAFDDACTQVSSFLSSASLNSPWRGVRDAAFKEVALNTLLMAGHTIKGVAPLSVPTDAERVELVQKIDDAIEAMKDGNDVFATLLISSLATLRMIVAKLEFYGVDGLFDHVLTTQAVLRSAESSQNDGGNQRGFAKAWNVLATIYLVLTIPDAGITAMENSYARYQAALQYFSQEVPTADVKLITGPPKDPRPHSSAEDGVALRPDAPTIETGGPTPNGGKRN